MLALLALSARPLPISLVADAARIDSDTSDAIGALRARRFVRTGFRAGRDVVEVIHERICEAIVSQLPESQVREYHGRLARALETSPAADPEALAVHLLGAGHKARAGKHAERAAGLAAQALAFGQAARLYRMALDVADATSPDALRLRVRLAEVIEGGGHAADAAHAYRDAAAHARGLERMDLERRAAEQLLTSGHIDEGAEALHQVLKAAGMAGPRTALGAAFWSIAYILAGRIVALRSRRSDADEVSRADHVHVEALYAVAVGWSFVDIVQSVYTAVRYLYLAQRKGDDFQLLRALSMEAMRYASRGGRMGRRERQCERTLDWLTDKHSSNPEFCLFRDGSRAMRRFMRGDWRLASDVLDGLRHDYTVPPPWHVHGTLFVLWSLYFLGRLAELRRRHAERIAYAEERGDLYTTVNLRIGHTNAIWLAADDPEAARRQVREAIGAWSHSGYHMQHYRAMLAEATIELYLGQGERAYDRVKSDWRKLRRSLLMTAQFVRSDAHFLRARCALASFVEAPANADRLAEAERIARKLQREKMGWIMPLAALVGAGVANLRGDRQTAMALLRTASESANAADMQLHAAVARLRLGALTGGSAGRELFEEADAFMRGQDIRVPERFAAILAPGFAGPKQLR